MAKKKLKTDPFAKREAEKYKNPIPSREHIIAFLKEEGVPFKFNELFKALRLKGDNHKEALSRRIKAMFRDGQLEDLRRGYFWITGQHCIVNGRVEAIKGKPVWVIPEDGGHRIAISKYNQQPVYDGTRVGVATINSPNFKFREGRIVEVLNTRQVVTGRFVEDDGFNYVIPHGKNYTSDIIIPHGKEGKAIDGDIVVITIISSSAPSHWKDPQAEVKEILGHERTPGIEIEAVSRSYGLPSQWTPEIKRSIADLSPEVPSQAKRGRVDLRDLPLVTIDGEDAQDFDDAVYCETRPNGGFRLVVAIADVSHYVRPNTPLDKEAVLRGNSTYFPGKVIPMLPEALSNGLCSLRPKVDRLCMVCDMLISKTGKLTKYEFYEGVMHSHARLTYSRVAKALKGDELALKAEERELLPQLQNLEDLYYSLRQQRESRGAIDFNTTEIKIVYSNGGKIKRIEPVQRNLAHKIIEECMLSANVATARFAKKHKLPILYRNHEGPPEEKLTDVRQYLSELDLSLGYPNKKPTALDYSRLIASIQRRDDQHVIQTILLRSLSQAVYARKNIGHFGLAYPAYCHFTSPIRRYPDLLVHRYIRMVLREQWDGSLSEKKEAKLDDLGRQCSMTERRSDDATREVERWLKCQYMDKHIGDEFEAVISGVTRFGFFAEIKDLYIDGLIHVTSLADDYYEYDQVHHRLIGERTGTIYGLGDPVVVRVSQVDVDDRKIDFELIKGGQMSKKKRKKKKGKQKK